MTEKDQISIPKIAKECAKDFSLIKNSGVDKTALPPRQWIRAWMQTHYNIIKLSGYFFREFKKALNSKSSINESNLGLNKHVQKKFDNIDDIVNINILEPEEFEKWATEYIESKSNYKFLHSYSGKIDVLYATIRITSNVLVFNRANFWDFDKGEGLSLFVAEDKFALIKACPGFESYAESFNRINKSKIVQELNRRLKLSSSEFIDRFLQVANPECLKESSLGLNKHIQKKFSEKDAVESVSKPFTRAMFDKICNLLDTNGFKEAPTLLIESSNVMVPTDYFTYSAAVYEDSIFSKVTGKEEIYNYYAIFVFIEKEPDWYEDRDDQMMCLEIRINPGLVYESEDACKKATIGTDRYDEIGWCGSRFENYCMASKDKGSAQFLKDAKYPVLKNSEPYVYEYLGITESSSEIDLSGDNAEKFLADVEGIIKTIYGFQRDRLKGLQYFATYSGFFATECWEILKKHFWKNTKSVLGKVEESNLGLNKRIQKKFEDKASNDKDVLDEVAPTYICITDTGKPVEVIKSDSLWKNTVFEWLLENVPTLRIKDDEKRAKIGREDIKVDDFLEVFDGKPTICMYHHEYSSYFHPMYVDRLADYFNGVLTVPYPLVLSAWNIGNYSIARVHLLKVGKKWRLQVEAYYQDKAYASKRRPNGQWRRAKKTVTAKDVPALNKLEL